MDWVLIGSIGLIELLIYLLGYFAGKSRAKTGFIKMLLKYKVILVKNEKPKDLEYGRK